MDHKPWLWRKKSSEKTISVISDEVPDREEKLVNENIIELEKSVKILKEKLSSALLECNTKGELVAKHEKVAKDALAGWEKEKAESAFLKKELDEALQQTVSKDERISHLDAALKECMQQLRFVREEKEQRIHDIIVRTGKESEKMKMVLEEKIAEANKSLENLIAEYNNLSKVLHEKEILIEELNELNSQAEADFNALMSRLNSAEKTNSSLKYEVCIIEKELEIRNEERDFNRRTADATQKLHLESVKKIAKLESECQRLRILVRKRLPGPAALATMKTEVEMLGREATDTRRKSAPPTGGSMVKDFRKESSLSNPSKQTNYLIERLCAVEEENKTLKETLLTKESELESSMLICARTASNLSQAEAQLAELSKSHRITELARNSPVSPLASIVEDKSNGDAESWASPALISELNQFKNEKSRGSQSSKSFGGSDISLMDDFAEMEKMAIVSVDKSLGSFHISDESNTPRVSQEKEVRLYSSKGTSRELFPVTDSPSEFTDKKHKGILKYPGWIHDILRIVFEQKRLTQRNFDDILADILAASSCMNIQGEHESFDVNKNLSLSSTSEQPNISGYIAWKPQNVSEAVDSFDQASAADISPKEVCEEKIQSSLSKSLRKLIELIEGIISQPSSLDDNDQNHLPRNDGSSFPYDSAATPTGYMVRVFQWKNSELSSVLRKFSHTCNDLLNGKSDLEQFARELTSAFDWAMNHCFSLQDVSSMRDTMKKNFDWDESQSENDNQSPRIFSSAISKERTLIHQMEEMQSKLKEENRMLKEEIAEKELAKMDLEGRIQSATNKIEELMIQLQVSEKSISNLQSIVETLRESKGMIEDQLVSHKLLEEDLNTQLSVATIELSEARQKNSSLEAELEDRSTCCQELESSCLTLQLQLASLTKKELSQYDAQRNNRQLKTDWEITAASEKLAECQATIFNLGKQLKALAPPKDTTLLENSTTTANNNTTTMTSKNLNNQRPSLLNHILADDDTGVEDDPKSPMMKEIICTTDSRKPPSGSLKDSNIDPNSSSKSIRGYLGSNETNYKRSNEMSLAIIPSKKRGNSSSGGFLRKLLSRRKTGSRKMSIPTVA
ncbi:hypothetical protein MKX01_034409 [Papaver californicum]|nr:hypothetical protein MKX01_034409 [Papaver californicum]